MICPDFASTERAIPVEPIEAWRSTVRASTSNAVVAAIFRWHGVKLEYATCRFGGKKIDVEYLVRIADLFRFRWDPPILAVLAERPFRFRALHTRLQDNVGEHVDDNALTRSLHRLTRQGLVRADSKRSGNRVIRTYGLSDKGRKYLETYEAIVAMYAHIERPPDDCDGKCSVHHRRLAEHAA